MSKITYKKSGVNIDKGNEFVRQIKPLCRQTKIPGQLSSLGGFASLFDTGSYGIKNPLLVSSTDGVGTKLELAHLQKKHDTIGIDLVAMCVNDLVVTGAKPIFFLDYFAVGKLNVSLAKEVLKGIALGCRQTGCALAGGETAEMPGFYADSKYDLAGFSVGIVDRKKVINGKKIRAGDSVLGLASTGPHSNGFSLIRKLFSKRELSGKWGKQALKPTKIYVAALLKGMKKFPIKGMAHITGGGFYDNIPRILPKGLGVKIELGSWKQPGIFDELQRRSKLDIREMYRTFNMGIGMAVIVSHKDAKKALSHFKRSGINAWEIGKVVKGKGVILE